MLHPHNSVLIDTFFRVYRTIGRNYFFGYSKYCSVAGMLLEFGLPSFNTLIYNYSVKFG